MRMALWLLALHLVSAVALGQATPGAPRSWQYGTLRFVAVQDDRLQTYDIVDPDRPRLTDDRKLGGYIADVKVQGGLLVVTLLAPRQHVLTVTDSGAVHELAPPPLPGDATVVALALAQAHAAVQHDVATAASIGRVVTVLHGEAALLLADGVAPVVGQALLVQPAPPSTLPPVAGAVTRAKGQLAVLELPRGAGVEPGDSVYRTQLPPERHRFLPPRGQYDTWFAAYLRPIAPFREVGIGLGFEIGATNGSLDLILRGSPITLLTNSVGPARFDASLAYDGEWYAFGFGGGVAKLVDRFCNFRFQFSGANGPAVPTDPAQCEEWTGVVTTDLRLGAADGLHLALGLGMGPSTLRQVFAQHDGRLVVPVSRSADLRMAWTAREDYAHFEIGGRYYLRGVGDRESLILTYGIGGVEIETLNDRLEGPSATFGLEWRK